MSEPPEHPNGTRAGFVFVDDPIDRHTVEAVTTVSQSCGGTVIVAGSNTDCTMFPHGHESVMSRDYEKRLIDYVKTGRPKLNNRKAKRRAAKKSRRRNWA